MNATGIARHVWAKMILQADSPVRLLKLSEDDFETLEQDQLAIQNMTASRFLATFETEVMGWQKSLAMVADVMAQVGNSNDGAFCHCRDFFFSAVC
jgi:hypothetical protein